MDFPKIPSVIANHSNDHQHDRGYCGDNGIVEK